MSFTNMNSTIAETMKFFMYKYNFTYHDWFVPLHAILKKTPCYVINSASTDDILDCLDLLSESYVMKETHVIYLMYIHINRRSKL